MTTTYAALPRGIDVSGHKKVPMDRLRELLSDPGHRDVRTCPRSGDAVFTTDADAAGDPAAYLPEGVTAPTRNWNTVAELVETARD